MYDVQLIGEFSKGDSTNMNRSLHQVESYIGNADWTNCQLIRASLYFTVIEIYLTQRKSSAEDNLKIADIDDGVWIDQ